MRSLLIFSWSSEETSTVDARYLQGTLWNISRYPYLDISDLQKWGKIIRLATFNKYICTWTLEVRDILGILWKRGEIAPENCSCFPQYFSPVVRFSCLGRDQIFTSRYAVIRDKRGRDSESQLYIPARQNLAPSWLQYDRVSFLQKVSHLEP